MFIEAKKLIGLPIAALDTRSKVAEIQNIVVDPQDGNVLGFLVKAGGFFSLAKTLSVVDIREWDPNGLVTDSVDNVVAPEEIVRINEVVNQKIELFGMKAQTRKGQNLGRVEDFLIDTDNNCVAKYYLRDLIMEPRVLAADKVVKIEPGLITFDDDAIDIPTGAEGAPA